MIAPPPTGLDPWDKILIACMALCGVPVFARIFWAMASGVAAMFGVLW